MAEVDIVSYFIFSNEYIRREEREEKRRKGAVYP
jgi:hypothetical protein